MSTASGREGENFAARYLEKQGYRIIDRNYRAGRGEIDIVARNRELLAFIEVKSHATHESGLLAVTPQKCERLKSAATAFLGTHPDLAALQCRFDLIILTPRRAWLGRKRFHAEHMPDIFR